MQTRCVQRQSTGKLKSYWASEASPTRGCSIEISGDINVGRSVCLPGAKMRRLNYVCACSKSVFWADKNDL